MEWLPSSSDLKMLRTVSTCYHKLKAGSAEADEWSICHNFQVGSAKFQCSFTMHLLAQHKKARVHVQAWHPEPSESASQHTTTTSTQQWGRRLLWLEPWFWAEGTGFGADGAGITVPLTDMKLSFLSPSYILLKCDALLFTFPKCFQNISDLKLLLVLCQSGIHHPPICTCYNHNSSQNQLQFHLLYDEAFPLLTPTVLFQRAYNGPPCAGHTGGVTRL